MDAESAIEMVRQSVARVRLHRPLRRSRDAPPYQPAMHRSLSHSGVTMGRQRGCPCTRSDTSCLFEIAGQISRVSLILQNAAATPAVSRRVQLEAHVGLALLERRHKQVVLTSGASRCSGEQARLRSARKRYRWLWSQESRTFGSGRAPNIGSTRTLTATGSRCARSSSHSPPVGTDGERC